jgi:hypothetical protein
LEVGIVIILVFAGPGYVGCPTIKGSPRGRAVEMDGILSLRVVHESHNGLSSPRDDKARSRRYPVIAYEGGR